MNEREIVEAIAGFDTADELNAIIKAARELCQPELDYSEWVGAVVEVRDANDREWMIDVFEGYQKDACYPFVCDWSSWRQCRLYTRPLKLIFTPHRSGDPCPVSGGEYVIIKRRNGDLCASKAKNFGWNACPDEPDYEIVGYMRIAL